MAEARTSWSACIVSITMRISGTVLLDLAGGLDAVHLGHRDVHQDHVGLQLLGQPDGLVAVAGLADDVESLVGHRAAQTFAQHPMVVGQHQSDRHGRNILFLGVWFGRGSVSSPTARWAPVEERMQTAPHAGAFADVTGDLEGRADGRRSLAHAEQSRRSPAGRRGRSGTRGRCR